MGMRAGVCQGPGLVGNRVVTDRDREHAVGVPTNRDTMRIGVSS